MSVKKTQGRTPNEKMHGDLPLGDSPPRSTHANGLTSSFYTEEHDICDGAVKLIRTKQSGDVWQLRTWIHKEKKYLKKSLRVKSLEEAKEKGRLLYYTLMGKIESGQKLFTITAGELVSKYTDYQQDRVDASFITKGRLSTIKTQLKHFIGFIGADRKLDNITREKYKDYYFYRRKHYPKVKDVTLINERATLGHMYKFALEKGFITQDRLPLWEELKRVDVGSRTAFNITDYKILYKHLQLFSKVKKPTDRENYNRKLIRDYILILSNTGLRLSECLHLKWNYVEIVKGKNKYPNIHIRVPAEISKVNKKRTAVGMRGDFFKRIKTYAKYTHQQDYIFADFDTGEPFSKKTLYSLWHQIMKESGLDQSPNNYTFYCLRHTFATYRLQYGKVDIRTLAKVMGCSVNYIESHYDSARVENMTDYITRGITDKEDGFSQVILD